MRISDDELRDILARAEEIQRSTRTAMQSEIEAVIGAGEAVGLARPALEQAVRERLDLVSLAPPVAGSLVFAQSADEKYYVAEVISVSTDSARVRFLRGGEHTVTPEQMRPCSFLPGERVVVDWPWWGPWKCTVVTYDAKREIVNLSDGWGETRWFPISDVWQVGRKVGMRGGRQLIFAKALGVGAGVGAIIGSVITALLLR